MWVTLTDGEAKSLLEALEGWHGEIAKGGPRPGWHTHVTDEVGNELTVAVGEPEASDSRQSDQPG